MVKGSHIITNKLYDEEVAFTLQNDDKRIVFVIPYKDEYSLIGTTEVDVNSPDNPSISDEEKIYLINIINNHFVKQISQEDIVIMVMMMFQLRHYLLTLLSLLLIGLK